MERLRLPLAVAAVAHPETAIGGQRGAREVRKAKGLGRTHLVGRPEPPREGPHLEGVLGLNQHVGRVNPIVCVTSTPRGGAETEVRVRLGISLGQDHQGHQEAPLRDLKGVPVVRGARAQAAVALVVRRQARSASR